jgi:protein-disulfide isomerase
MMITRRVLLGPAMMAAVAPARAAGVDERRTDRAVGSATASHTVIECFSLTCPHCADFAKDAWPALKAKWVAAGKTRWVFYDLPTDGLALRAAAVARYLPPDRYEHFVGRLFATQDRWAFAGGDDQAGLWQVAGDAGMDRATFERAIADNDLRAWILGRAMEAETKWHIDATPSFLVDGKLYVGAMSAGEFGAILAG